jgi:putative transposase
MAQVAAFIAADQCTTECAGVHASMEANRFEALEQVRQGVNAALRGYGANVARGLELRHDHGSPYGSEAFWGELDFLCIESSPPLVRAPEGTSSAERFIRTPKEQLLEELRRSLRKWLRTYNASNWSSDTATARQAKRGGPTT